MVVQLKQLGLSVSLLITRVAIYTSIPHEQQQAILHEGTEGCATNVYKGHGFSYIEGPISNVITLS
jgi:hypothetical protein